MGATQISVPYSENLTLWVWEFPPPLSLSLYLQTCPFWRCIYLHPMFLLTNREGAWTWVSEIHANSWTLCLPGLGKRSYTGTGPPRPWFIQFNSHRNAGESLLVWKTLLMNADSTWAHGYATGRPMQPLIDSFSAWAFKVTPCSLRGSWKSCVILTVKCGTGLGHFLVSALQCIPKASSGSSYAGWDSPVLQACRSGDSTFSSRWRRHWLKVRLS